MMPYQIDFGSRRSFTVQASEHNPLPIEAGVGLQNGALALRVMYARCAEGTATYSTHLPVLALETPDKKSMTELDASTPVTSSYVMRSQGTDASRTSATRPRSALTPAAPKTLPSRRPVNTPNQKATTSRILGALVSANLPTSPDDTSADVSGALRFPYSIRSSVRRRPQSARIADYKLTTTSTDECAVNSKEGPSTSVESARESPESGAPVAVKATQVEEEVAAAALDDDDDDADEVIFALEPKREVAKLSGDVVISVEASSYGPITTATTTSLGAQKVEAVDLIISHTCDIADGKDDARKAEISADDDCHCAESDGNAPFAPASSTQPEQISPKTNAGSDCCTTAPLCVTSSTLAEAPTSPSMLTAVLGVTQDDLRRIKDHSHISNSAEGANDAFSTCVGGDSNVTLPPSRSGAALGRSAPSPFVSTMRSRTLSLPSSDAVPDASARRESGVTIHVAAPLQQGPQAPQHIDALPAVAIETTTVFKVLDLAHSQSLNTATATANNNDITTQPQAAKAPELKQLSEVAAQSTTSQSDTQASNETPTVPVGVPAQPQIPTGSRRDSDRRLLFSSWAPISPDDAASHHQQRGSLGGAGTKQKIVEEFLDTVVATHKTRSGSCSDPVGGDPSAADLQSSENTSSYHTHSMNDDPAPYLSQLRPPVNWAAVVPVTPRGTRRSSSFVETRTLTIPEMWRLIRVYIRIRLYASRWKKRHCKEEPAKVRDQVSALMEQYDSTNWLHAFTVEWFERKSQNMEKTRKFSSSSMGGRRNYERAFLHLSASHVYISSQSSTNSRSIRYTDVVQIVPTNGGLDVVFIVDEDSDNDEAAEVATEASDGGFGRSTSFAFLGRANQSEGHFQPISPQSSSPASLPQQQSTRKRLHILSDEGPLIAVNLLELQSRFLRMFSLSLAERIVYRSSVRTITIVHFNDVYHLPPFKPANARGVVGGAGRFHTVLAKIRETSNPLVLFSGDFMGPSLMSVITKGKQMVDALNFLGVHYGCFGNHEFDFGLRVLKEVIHGYTQGKHIYPGSQTTWLMSNMVEPSTGNPLGDARPYSICVWNGVRVGLLGLCENWLPQCANLHPSEAAYLDIFERGETLAQFLKEHQGADIVIALTHCRYAVDREVSRRCPTIDYILGGHDHKFKNDPKNRILKSGQEFEYLSTVDVTIVPEKKAKFRINCTPITYDIAESEYLRGLISRYDAKMAEKLGRTIGKTEVALDSTEETVRFKEGHLTNFILDIIQQSMETELAFLGAAAISGKEVKLPGNVTLGDVFGWFPNETKVMTMKLKGKTIRKTLDVMVRELPAEAPSFPHPSQQLRFTINVMSKPPVCENITINGSPLDPERVYLCAVEDFVGTGKAKYKHVAIEGEAVLGEEDAVQVVTLVRDYFVKRKERTANDNKDAIALKNVTKIVSSATHIGVDMDMAKSQRFIRSLICELLHCNRSSIFLVEADEVHFVPDGKDDVMRLPKDKGLVGYCATTCQLLNIEDVYTDPRFNQEIDRLTGYRTKTMLACPVLLDGKNCCAVVQAINKDGDVAFDELDEMMLRVLGEQVSFQLRFQTIFQKAREDLEFTMSYILDIFRSMTSDVSIDLSGAFKSIAAHAISCFRCDTVRVYAIDEANMQARYLEEGLDDESVLISADIAPLSIVHQLLTAKVPVLMKDASRATILKASENSQCRSLFALPLISFSGVCVGAILLCDKPRGFTSEDEAIGEHFGRLAAVSMESSMRLSRLLAASTETTLPTVPSSDLDRIRMKGGWATVRKVYRDAIHKRRQAEHEGLVPLSLEEYFDPMSSAPQSIMILEGSMIRRDVALMGSSSKCSYGGNNSTNGALKSPDGKHRKTGGSKLFGLFDDGGSGGGRRRSGQKYSHSSGDIAGDKSLSLLQHPIERSLSANKVPTPKNSVSIWEPSF